MSAESSSTSPHSASLFSLIYNTTSSLLQQVVSVEVPEAEQEPQRQQMTHGTESSNIIQPSSPGEKSDTSLVDYFFDLAGFGGGTSQRGEQRVLADKVNQEVGNHSPLINPGTGGIDQGKENFGGDLGNVQNKSASLGDHNISKVSSTKSIFDEEELRSLGFDMISPAIPAELPPAVAAEKEEQEDNLYHPSRQAQAALQSIAEPRIFTASLIEKLHVYLPAILKESTNLKLLYSLEKHGISMSTLFRNTKDQGASIIVIKTSDNQVFGAFSSESIAVHVGFYGNGQSFLWRADDKDGSTVQVFQATGKNDYYILSEAHMLAFGGGNGKFGLWIDEELFNGSSQHCDTFDNQPLSRQTEFTISAIEIWAFE